MSRLPRTTFLFVALAAGLVLGVSGCGAKRPDDVGIAALAPCPETPNCVSSLAPASSEAFIEPMIVVGPPEEAWAVVLDVLEAWPRTRVVSADAVAIHAEATSFVFRFVDDLELRLHALEARIDVRSASRVGRSDLGANRRRVEKLRDELVHRGVVSPGSASWQIAP